MFALLHGATHLGLYRPTVHTVLRDLTNSFLSSRCMFPVCCTVLLDFKEFSLTISSFFLFCHCHCHFHVYERNVSESVLLNTTNFARSYMFAQKTFFSELKARLSANNIERL